MDKTLCNFTDKEKKDFDAYCKTIAPNPVIFRELLFTEDDCPKNGTTCPNYCMGIGSSTTGKKLLIPTFTFDSSGNVLSRLREFLSVLPRNYAILKECEDAYDSHIQISQPAEDDLVCLFVLRCTLVPKEVGIVLFSGKDEYDYKIAIGGKPILSEEEMKNEEFQDKIKDRLR